MNRAARMPRGTGVLPDTWMWKRLATLFARPIAAALRAASSCSRWPLGSAVRLTLLVAAGGLTLLSLGLWWIYPPAALIVSGALLLAEAERMSRKLEKAPSRPAKPEAK